jgi:hypothetical protein
MSESEGENRVRSLPPPCEPVWVFVGDEVEPGMEAMSESEGENRVRSLPPPCEPVWMFVGDEVEPGMMVAPQMMVMVSGMGRAGVIVRK